MKRFIAYFIWIILFAGSVLGIVFGVLYKQEQGNKSTISEVRLIEEYNKGVTIGYENGAKVGFDKGYKDGYNKGVDDVAENEEYKTLLYNLHEAEELRDYYKSEYEKTCVLLETEKSLVADKDSTIAQKDNLLAEKIENIENLENQISTLNSQIAELNATITSLRNSLTEYEEYISNLENDLYCYVTFYLKDDLYLVQQVTKGSKCVVQAPSNTDDYRFIGWTLSTDSTELVDLNTYLFTTNTTLYAVLETKLVVNFYDKDNETILSTQRLFAGEEVTFPTLDKTEYFGYKWVSGSPDSDVDFIGEVSSNTNVYLKYYATKIVNCMTNKDLYFVDSDGYETYVIPNSVLNIQVDSFHEVRSYDIKLTMNIHSKGIVTVVEHVDIDDEHSFANACPTSLTLQNDAYGLYVQVVPMNNSLYNYRIYGFKADGTTRGIVLDNFEIEVIPIISEKSSSGGTIIA